MSSLENNKATRTDGLSAERYISCPPQWTAHVVLQHFQFLAWVIANAQISSGAVTSVWRKDWGHAIANAFSIRSVLILEGVRRIGVACRDWASCGSFTFSQRFLKTHELPIETTSRPPVG